MFKHHNNKSSYLHNLYRPLRGKFKRSGSTTNSEESISALGQVINFPASNHPKKMNIDQALEIGDLAFRRL
jgi:hypothetical protein